MATREKLLLLPCGGVRATADRKQVDRGHVLIAFKPGRVMLGEVPSLAAANQQWSEDYEIELMPRDDALCRSCQSVLFGRRQA